MAYGLYLYKEIKEFRLEIHRKDYTGDPIEIRAMGSTPLRLLGLDNSGHDVQEPVIKSSLEIDIRDLGEVPYKEFFTSDATKFKVLLFESGKQIWGGYITPDSYSQPLEYRASINLIARDNLGLLEQLDYDWFDSDFVTFGALIEEAQRRIDWVMDPIVFRTSLVSGTGEKPEAAYINTVVFEEGNWWDAVTSVISSIGCQLRYVGRNRVEIINIADLATIGDSRDISYAIDGAAQLEIVPSWREVTISQDYGVISNAFRYNLSADSFDYVQDSSQNWNRATTPLYKIDQWRYDDHQEGLLFFNPYDFPHATDPFDRYYNATLLYRRRGTSAAYIFRSYPVEPTDIPISWSFKCWNYFVYNSGNPNSRPDFPKLYKAYYSGGNPTTEGWYNVVLRCAVRLVATNGNIYFLSEDGWSTNANNYITFTLPEYRVTGGQFTEQQETLTINIASIPYSGTLALMMYQPEYTNVSAYGETQLECVVLSDFSLQAQLDISGLEIKGIVNDKGNVKGKVDIDFGEVPPYKGGGMFLGGGLYKGASASIPLTDWQRTDGAGGILNLSELVGRAYAHHYSGFTNTAGEITGGQVISATVPFESADFGRIFVRGEERYALNSGIYDILRKTCQVTLIQVRPYEHNDYDVAAAAIDTGGGSRLSGGSSNVVTWSTSGNSRRIYDLDTATEEEAKTAYIVLDKMGNSEAKKFPLSGILQALGYFYEVPEIDALGTRYNLFSEQGISQYGSSEGGSGGGGDGGTMLHNLLENRDLPDQHPMSAVTGLGTALNLKLDRTDIQSWALQPSKPQYTIAEIHDLTLALNSKLDKNSIYDWALRPEKPSYSITEITGLESALSQKVDLQDAYTIRNANLATVDWIGKEITAYGGKLRAYNKAGGGEYLELAKYKGSLPGFENDYYPTLRTDYPNLYFSIGDRYTGYIADSTETSFALRHQGASALGVKLSTELDSFVNIQGGNFGIGTSSPAYKLDVAGTGCFTDRVRVANAGGQGTYFELAKYRGVLPTYPNSYYPTLRTDFEAFYFSCNERLTGGIWDNNSETYFALLHGGESIALRLSTRGASYVNTVSGNFGIGITAPAYKLDVAGSGHFNQTLHLGTGGDGVTNPRLTFQNPAGGNPWHVVVNEAGELCIYCGSTLIQRIDTSGNVWVKSGITQYEV